MANVKAERPRTLDEKIDLTRALLARYLRQKNALSILNNFQVGDVVTFKFGRRDTVRLMKGPITGVRDTKAGKYVAILSGEGFDTATYKVRVQDITHNETAKNREPTNE